MGDLAQQLTERDPDKRTENFQRALESEDNKPHPFLTILCHVCQGRGTECPHCDDKGALSLPSYLSKNKDTTLLDLIDWEKLFPREKMTLAKLIEYYFNGLEDKFTKLGSSMKNSSTKKPRSSSS